jgi:hypothetical protein
MNRKKEDELIGYTKEIEDACESIYLNQTQTQLLIEVSKQTGNISSLKLSRKVYYTAVSGYNNLILLKDLGLINIYRKHNINVSELTDFGRLYLHYLSKDL